jgi:hypothetical protein
MFWAGFFSGIAVLLGLAACALALAYRFSPEGREGAAIRDRLRAEGVQARSELRQQRWNKVREELRREGNLPT